MKNILFRADSSSTLGTGHIMRDLVLAQREFKSDQVFFAVLPLEGNINYKIEEAGYDIVELPSTSFDDLNQLITDLDIDMVVIDHYAIDMMFEKKLKELNPNLKVLSFDDTYEKHCCDILLNHNISADERKYKGLVPGDCELRCGSGYTLLRDEFYSEKGIKREKKYDIFVAMGGADTANLNISILEAFPRHYRVALLTTTANKHLEGLKKYIEKKQQVTLFVNSNEVAKLMNLSRLAIVTPSVTVNEVYHMGLDFIAIKTAENQSEIYNYLKENNFIVLDGFCKKSLEKAVDLIADKKVKLVDFVDTSFAEQEMVLQWRNHENVRKWMFKKDVITLEEHVTYVKYLKHKTDRKYFLVKQNSQPIGVVDYTNLTKEEAYIGIYANPALRGIGSILMRKLIQYAFLNLSLKRLIAQVFTENSAAIKLYKKFGFQEISQHDNVVTMEKLNEYR